ncbi:class I SAM-dependent methyltransferase [Streptomyces flavofungini]|uniref:class I SAM-dependent methyltransferase n=1 Tax=Streptomyces flavofungini TaxID=68200 RepID=UPI0025B1F868|nr:class I SAM-dependent methyltransferase [Streptomyces flavofungini]WJV45637.1 class I SAM-dependent methyltransferase [Streptomyces flavofungini]
MKGQFDALARDYARMAEENPVRVHSERFTLLDVLGDVRGRKVLDMGCGTGQYTRLLRDLGAVDVTGIDASEGMLEHARWLERDRPRGVRYVRRDACRTPRGAAPADSGDPELEGIFHTVVSVYLLPYARTEQELTSMCRTARGALRPQGGRYLTVTLNPDVSMTPHWYEPYGYEVVAPHRTDEAADAADKDADKDDEAEAAEPGAARTDGFPYRARVHVGARSVTLDAYRWSRAAHERALRRAGFERITWIRPRISAEGRRLYADGFWDNYLHCPQILLADCLAGPASPS